MYIIDYNQDKYEHKNIIFLFLFEFNQILQDFINKKIINIFIIYNLN